MSGLLQEELSYVIRGCAYDIANKYGCGLKEKIYENALIEVIEKKGLACESQKRIHIYSQESGKVLGTYVPDLIVNDCVVVEIKATEFTRKQDIDQQRSYLRVSWYEIGYLVNFGVFPLDIRRSIYTNDRKPFLHNE